MLAGLTVFAVLIVLYGAVAGWLSQRSITSHPGCERNTQLLGMTVRTAAATVAG